MVVCEGGQATESSLRDGDITDGIFLISNKVCWQLPFEAQPEYNVRVLRTTTLTQSELTLQGEARGSSFAAPIGRMVTTLG